MDEFLKKYFIEERCLIELNTISGQVFKFIILPDGALRAHEIQEFKTVDIALDSYVPAIVLSPSEWLALDGSSKYNFSESSVVLTVKTKIPTVMIDRVIKQIKRMSNPEE